MESRKNITKDVNNGPPWLAIAIATIGVIGSIGPAYVTARATAHASVQDQVPSSVADYLDERFPNLTLADIRTGLVNGNRADLDWHLDTVPKLAPRSTDRVERNVYRKITFDPPFSATPHVLVAITTIDASNESHLRLIAMPGDVTPEGFTLTIQTWSDTQLYWVQVEWLAYQLQEGKKKGIANSVRP